MHNVTCKYPLITLAFDQSRLRFLLFISFYFNEGIERQIALLISQKRLARHNSMNPLDQKYIMIDRCMFFCQGKNNRKRAMKFFSNYKGGHEKFSDLQGGYENFQGTIEGPRNFFINKTSIQWTPGSQVYLNIEKKMSGQK